ncbi:hypothetical protein TNCV_1342771 [Trichonephila clavipes]|nr:hypothetical protein TNCV_1342771 [Trichonephila clavipes]
MESWHRFWQPCWQSFLFVLFCFASSRPNGFFWKFVEKYTNISIYDENGFFSKEPVVNDNYRSVQAVPEMQEIIAQPASPQH